MSSTAVHMYIHKLNVACSYYGIHIFHCGIHMFITAVTCVNLACSGKQLWRHMVKRGMTADTPQKLRRKPHGGGVMAA